MMKNWKKIAALLVVLVVFVGAFIFLNSNKDKLGSAGNTPSPTASADAFKPLDITRDQIAKIILKREGGDIALTKAEKEIEKVNQKEDGTTEKTKEKVKVWVTSGFDVESSKVDDIAVAAETLTTQRLIDENPPDITMYGLDQPLVTTLVSTDGKEYGLEIGDKTPAGDAYYFRKSGSSSVYTIDSYKGDTLSLGRFDIVSRSLYGSQAVTVDDLTALTFTKEGKEFFASDKSTGGDWFLTSPLKHKADLNEFTYFLNWLSGLKAKNYVAQNPSDLKAYGLDKPKYVFDYTLSGKTYRLMLGAKNEEKAEYFAQMEGNPFVFTVDSAALSFVDYTLLDLTEVFIYIPNIVDVEKLVIELDGRKDELLINTDNDQATPDEFVINGKKIANEDKAISAFKGYYQGAIGISADKIDLEAKPTGQAEIRLTYTMKKAGPDGKVVVVELIPTPDGYGYYLMKNGEYSGLVMSGRELDKPDMIRQQYKELIETIK